MIDTMMRQLNRIEATLPMPWTGCLMMLVGAFVLVRFWMALVLLTWQIH